MTREIKDVVSHNLKAIRLRLGLSQKVVAEQAGVDVRFLQRCERTSQNLTLDNIAKLAAGLHVTPDELLKLSNDAATPKPLQRAFSRPTEAIDYAIEVLKTYKNVIE